MDFGGRGADAVRGGIKGVATRGNGEKRKAIDKADGGAQIPGSDLVGEEDVVRIMALSNEMTTQQAADFLGISRPSLVKLLEQGYIPYLQPTPGGAQRRVRLEDLVSFHDRLAADAARRGWPLLEAGRKKWPVESKLAKQPLS